MNVIEPLKRIEQFSSKPEIKKEDWIKTLDWVLGRIRENISIFRTSFPTPASNNNRYSAIDNDYWTSSFWTGMLYLAWEASNDPVFREAADLQLASYRKRLDERIGTDTHDLGFLYTLSCKAAWQLTGNRAARDSALKAADLLMTRYYEKAGIIQAWGDLNDPAQKGRIIIDCAMNLPLLYWAARETDNPFYREAAERHIKTANRYIVRNDWTSYHTYFFDTTKGIPLKGETAQGYSNDSCWSRGQAWGIYGNALSYRYLRDPALLETARGLAHYFLNRLPDDLVSYWDLIFTEGSEERDSSAAAICVCGLLELAAQLPVTDPDHDLFENAALHMLAKLAQDYTAIGVPESNGILMHSVYAKPDNKGIDECTLWGDYFFTEALYRILYNWEPYW